MFKIKAFPAFYRGRAEILNRINHCKNQYRKLSVDFKRNLIFNWYNLLFAWCLRQWLPRKTFFEQASIFI
jgi:hypothetical protein